MSDFDFQQKKIQSSSSKFLKLNPHLVQLDHDWLPDYTVKNQTMTLKVKYVIKYYSALLYN